MFLDYLKGFVIKKAIDKSLSADVVATDVHKIKTVGIVVDQTFLNFIPRLKQNLLAYGIKDDTIEIIVRNSNLKAENVDKYDTFNASMVTWNGAFLESPIKKFIEKDFDLLISYYQEKPVLMLVSSLSRASFKVGFSSIDKRINNLIIDASAADYSIFDQELFKYLKILNTI